MMWIITLLKIFDKCFFQCAVQSNKFTQSYFCKGKHTEKLQISAVICLVLQVLCTLSFGSSQNPKRTMLNINQFSLFYC